MRVITFKEVIEVGVINSCDRCERSPVPAEELHRVEIKCVNNDKPSMKSIEVCVFCKEALIPLIREVQENE